LRGELRTQKSLTRLMSGHSPPFLGSAEDAVVIVRPIPD
jgi:hypothetical protein